MHLRDVCACVRMCIFLTRTTFLMQGEVYASLGSTVQIRMYQTLGSIFSGNLHKAKALDIQSDAMRQSLDLYRYSLGENYFFSLSRTIFYFGYTSG